MYLSQTSHHHHKWLGSVAAEKKNPSRTDGSSTGLSAKATHAKAVCETILWWGPNVRTLIDFPQATSNTLRC